MSNFIKHKQSGTLLALLLVLSSIFSACASNQVSTPVPETNTRIIDEKHSESTAPVPIVEEETSVPTNPIPAEDIPQGFLYEESPDGIIITKYTDPIQVNVIIPNEIRGYPVTSIGAQAFQNCSHVQSVTIPESVTTIGFAAFDGCSQLSSVSIPDSVTKIDYYAFANCTALSEITIPASVLRVEDDCFLNTTCTVHLKRLEVAESFNLYDTVSFGTSYLSGHKSSGELEWIVAAKEAGRVLLISKQGLYCAPFHAIQENINWERSSIRSWLNERFLQSCFTGIERQYILPVVINTDGVKTSDNVFLLSKEDVNQYLPTKDMRQATPSASAKENGAFANSSDFCWWWLRSSGGNFGTYKAVVNADGNIADGYYVDAQDGCIRPAIWLNLSGILSSKSEQVDIDFTIEKSEKVYTTMDNEIKYRFIFDQVVLNDESPSSRKINAAITAAIESTYQDYIDRNRSYFDDDLFGFDVFTSTWDFVKVCDNPNGILSILMKADQGTKSAHLFGLNYDSFNGTPLNIPQRLGLSESEFLNQCKIRTREYLEAFYDFRVAPSFDAISLNDISIYINNGEVILSFTPFTIENGGSESYLIPTGLLVGA